MKCRKHSLSILEPYYSNNKIYDKYSFLTNINYFKECESELKIAIYPYNIDEILDEIKTIPNLLVISKQNYIFVDHELSININMFNDSKLRIIDVGNVKFGIIQNDELFDNSIIDLLINEKVNAIIYVSWTLNTEFSELLDKIIQGDSVKLNVFFIYLTLGNPLGPNKTKIYNAKGIDITEEDNFKIAPIKLAKQIEIRNSIGAPYFNLPKIKYSKEKGEPKRRITGRDEGGLINWISISTYDVINLKHVIANKKFTILNTKNIAQINQIFRFAIEEKSLVKKAYIEFHNEIFDLKYVINSNTITFTLPKMLLPGEQITFHIEYEIFQSNALKVLTGGFMSSIGVINVHKKEYTFTINPNKIITMDGTIRNVWSNNNLNKDLEIGIKYEQK